MDRRKTVNVKNNDFDDLNDRDSIELDEDVTYFDAKTA